MATASPRFLVVSFVVIGLPLFSMLKATTTVSSVVAGSNLIGVLPRFDTFVLYGQIHCQKLKELRRDKVRLSVDLGKHVWLQNIENEYYMFNIPSKNTTGMAGILSMLASDDCGTTLWSQFFTVQDDVGAYRLDINIGEIGLTTFYHGCSSQDGVLNRTFGSKSKLLEGTESIGRDYQANQHAPANFLTGGLILIQQEGPGVAEVAYSEHLIFYARCLQMRHLCFVGLCFIMLRLSEALLHKSILLLDASWYSVREVSSSSNADLAVGQVCPRKLTHGTGPCFVSQSSGDMSTDDYGSKYSFEDAWHVAEQYLNEAIDNDCQGAYFSYNCTSAQQERQESALGRWNRDNAGRLIRQLWSDNGI